MSNTPIAPHPIQLVLIEKNEFMRQGIRTILEQTREFRVVDEADSLEDFLTRSSRKVIDILIWVIGPNEVSILKTRHQLLQRLKKTKIMLLASGIDKRTLLQISQATGASCLIKDVQATELIHSLRMLKTGTQIIFSSHSSLKSNIQLPDSDQTVEMDLLTKKERKLVEMIAQGFTNKEIAKTMDVSEKTIKNYVSRIFDKLHVTRRSQVAALFGAGKI